MTLRAVDLLPDAIERTSKTLAAPHATPFSGTFIVERPYAGGMKRAGDYIASAKKGLELADDFSADASIVEKVLDVVDGYLDLAAEAPGGKAAAREIADVRAELNRRRAKISGP